MKKQCTIKGTTDTKEDLEKSYKISGVCKQDLLDHLERFPNSPFNVTDIMALDEADLQEIAERMHDCFLETVYWDSLEEITKEVLDSK